MSANDTLSERIKAHLPTQRSKEWLAGAYPTVDDQEVFTAYDMLAAFRAGWEDCDAHHYDRSTLRRGYWR